MSTNLPKLPEFTTDEVCTTFFREAFEADWTQFNQAERDKFRGAMNRTLAEARRQSQSLPAGPVAGLVGKWRDEALRFIDDSQNREFAEWVRDAASARASAKNGCANELEQALQADAREKGEAWNEAIEAAAKEADHWLEIGKRRNPPALCVCGSYIAGAIRGLATQPAQASEKVITVCGTCYGKGYVMDGNGSAMTREPCPNCVPVATHPQPVTPAGGEVVRPCRDTAMRAITQFLRDELSDAPAFAMTEDGDSCWSFWITEEGVEDDTTSYVRADLSVEWYGTSYEPAATHPPVADAALVLDIVAKYVGRNSSMYGYIRDDIAALNQRGGV